MRKRRKKFSKVWKVIQECSLSTSAWTAIIWCAVVQIPAIADSSLIVGLIITTMASALTFCGLRLVCLIADEHSGFFYGLSTELVQTCVAAFISGVIHAYLLKNSSVNISGHTVLDTVDILCHVALVIIGIITILYLIMSMFLGYRNRHKKDRISRDNHNVEQTSQK